MLTKLGDRNAEHTDKRRYARVFFLINQRVQPSNPIKFNTFSYLDLTKSHHTDKHSPIKNMNKPQEILELEKLLNTKFKKVDIREIIKHK